MIGHLSAPVPAHFKATNMRPSCQFKIAWGDCDPSGLVHHPRCFYWMDTALQTLLHKLDLNHHTLVKRYGAHIPIVQTHAQFFAPATYDQTLTVEVKISHWSAKSFRIEYTGLHGDETIFQGYEARAWVIIHDDGSIAATIIPTEFRETVCAAGI